MIFQHTYQLVLAGKKTQTRRVVKGPKPPCRVGAMLEVQPGRGKKAVCRVLVTDVRKGRLGDLTMADVRAEGYASRREFVRVWTAMHGQFDPATRVWVITFEPPAQS